MKNSFRHCFNNALVHYQLWLVEVEMMRMTNAFQGSVGNPNPNTTPGPASATALDDSVRTDGIQSEEKAPKLDKKSLIDAHHYHNAHSAPTFSTPNLPSDYLQSRCPCCFGGSSVGTSGLQADCIISLNANFQLKQIWDYDQCQGVKNLSFPGGHDPKMVLPFTIEVPCLDTKLWQSKLEAMWGSKKRKRTRNPVEQDEPEVDTVAKESVRTQPD